MMPAPNCGDWSAIGYICDLIAAASCTASRDVLNQQVENFVDNKIKTCHVWLLSPTLPPH